MKRLFAIALSLLLIGVQLLALAQPVGGTPADCRCCNCQQTDCCVAESSSTSPPPASAPVASHQFNLQLFALPALLAWMIPACDPSVSSSVASPLVAAHIPLFTRDCALLI